jgi:hypothetical protein
MAKIDWSFTEDGDIMLGEPQTDTDGKILYKHKDGSVDTEKGEDGKEIRDLDVSYDLDAEKQTIFNRLRTDSPDWYHYPTMGGNLTDLIGEPNTRETGNKGAALITAALTYGGLYSATQVNVRAVPISQNELLFLIEISKTLTGVFRLPLTFNLETGLMDEYVPTT